MSHLPFLVKYGTETWVLVAVVIVAAAAAWLHHRGATWSRVGAYMPAIGLLVIFGMVAAGQLALRIGRHRGRPYVAYEQTNLDALAIAAALPGSRGAALDEIVDQFDGHYVRDAVVLDAWQEAERIRGGCGRELAMLRGQERIRQLAALARDCDDDASASAALLFMGDYAEAARRGGNAPAQIGARNWRAIVSLVARIRPRISDPTYAARFACAELFFRTRAGEPDAAREIHTAAAGNDLVCGMIDALLQPEPAPALVAVYQRARVGPDADYILNQTIEALLWISGGGVRPPWISTLNPQELAYIAPSEPARIKPAVLWPLATAARPWRDDPVQEAVARLWHANYLVLRGDLAGAESEIAEVAKQPTNDATVADAVRSLSIAVSLRGGKRVTDDAVRDYLHPAIRNAADLAVGRMPTGERQRIGIGCDADAETDVAQLAALRGDGNRLSDLADRCRLRAGFGIEPWFGLVPHIRDGRERIASQLVAAAPDFVDASGDPFAVVGRAVLRRDLARLAGDQDSVVTWQAIIDRHLDVLADRDVATGLMIWQLLNRAL